MHNFSGKNDKINTALIPASSLQDPSFHNPGSFDTSKDSKASGTTMGKLRSSFKTSSPEEKVSRLKVNGLKKKEIPPADTLTGGKSILLSQIDDDADDDTSPYAMFRRDKNHLSKLLDRASELMYELEMENLTQQLKEMSNRIHSETLKVQIVGTFKNGKSTFINSFLGKEVLPAHALPCTAVINELKYAETKKAVIHFKNPLPEELPNEIPAAALSHIKKHPGGKIPPMEIPYDKIEQYVVIPLGKDPKDMILESPYEKVELFWPLDLLKNGVEIVDSPGLNEHSTRTKVTMDFISKSDAVIFVLNATTLCSMEEMNFIEHNLKAQGFKDLFFVVNRFDMIPDKEKNRIMKYAISKLLPFTSFGEKGIFFISARNALEAKSTHDKEKLIHSGLPRFEDSLSDFLTKKKGNMKLVLPARQLNKFLKSETIGKIIPRHRSMLDTSVDDLKKNYNKMLPVLDSLERKRQFLYDKTLLSISQCGYKFESMVSNNLSGTIADIPMWIDTFIPSQDLGIVPSKQKLESVSQEITSHFARKMEAHQTYWQESVLLPAIKDNYSTIFDSAKSETNVILDEAQHALARLSKDHTESLSSKRTLSSEVSFFEARGNVSSATRKLTMNISGQTMNSLQTLSGASILSGAVSSIFTGAKGTSGSPALVKLKSTITEKAVVELRRSTMEFSHLISDEILNFYKTSADRLVSSIDNEIELIKSQFHVSIAEMEKGESAISRKKEHLHELECSADDLCKSLDDFITKYA